MIVKERTEFRLMGQNIVFGVPQIIHSVDRTTQFMYVIAWLQFMYVMECKFSK